MNTDDLAPGAVLTEPGGARWLVDRRSWMERGGDPDVAHLLLTLVRVPADEEASR